MRPLWATNAFITEEKGNKGINFRRIRDIHRRKFDRKENQILNDFGEREQSKIFREDK